MKPHIGYKKKKDGGSVRSELETDSGQFHLRAIAIE